MILIIMTTKNKVRPQLYSDYAPVKHGQETQTILIKDFAHVISVPPSHRNARWWRSEAIEMHVCEFSMDLKKLQFGKVVSML